MHHFSSFQTFTGHLPWKDTHLSSPTLYLFMPLHHVKSHNDTILYYTSTYVERVGVSQHDNACSFIGSKIIYFWGRILFQHPTPPPHPYIYALIMKLDMQFRDEVSSTKFTCTQKTHTDIVQNHFAVNFASDLVRNPKLFIS